MFQLFQVPAGKRSLLAGDRSATARSATRYSFGGTPRIDPAEELYIFRQDGENSERLLTILEQIVHGWVTGKTRHARLPA